MHAPQPAKRPRVRVSFLLILSTVLFAVIAGVMNFSLRSRYDDVLYMLAHKNEPLHVNEVPENPEIRALSRQRSKNQYVQGGISAVLLCAALFVILSGRYTPTDKHWAYGTIGTIVGFWFGAGP